MSLNKVSVASFSLMCASFIPLSCFIALTRRSSMIPNRGSESGHPYFSPDLRGTISLLPLTMMVAVCLLWITLYPFGKTLLFLLSYHKLVLNLVMCFSCISKGDHIHVHF